MGNKNIKNILLKESIKNFQKNYIYDENLLNIIRSHEHGTFIQYWKGGNVKEIRIKHDGQTRILWLFYNNGKIKEYSYHLDGKLHGVQYLYYHNMYIECNWNHGRFIIVRKQIKLSNLNDGKMVILTINIIAISILVKNEIIFN